MLLLLLAVVQQPDFSRAIDFRTPPARVVNILPGLAKKAGVTLQAAGPPRDDVLVISVKNRPVSEIMDKIAEATSSNWVKKGSAFELTSDKAIAAKELQMERNAEIVRWQKLIDVAQSRAGAVTP